MDGQSFEQFFEDLEKGLGSGILRTSFGLEMHGLLSQYFMSPRLKTADLVLDDFEIEYHGTEITDRFTPIGMHSGRLLVKEVEEEGVSRRLPDYFLLKGSILGSSRMVDTFSEQRNRDMLRTYYEESSNNLGFVVSDTYDMFPLRIGANTLCRDAYFIWSRAFSLGETLTSEINHNSSRSLPLGTPILVETNRGEQLPFFECEDVDLRDRVKNVVIDVGGVALRMLSYV